jgi:hypothetical protein
MGMAAAFLTVWIVLAVMAWLILPRLTDEERAVEDREFLAEYARRKGNRQ